MVWRLLGGVLGSEVRRLVMRAGHDGSAAFTVMGSGAAADDVRQFLVWLADHGRARTRSAPTRWDWRTSSPGSMAVGTSWAKAKATAARWRATSLSSVAVRTGLAPRVRRGTVNHRISVLGSFFAFLIARDCDRGRGVWAAESSGGARRPNARQSRDE